MARTPTRFPTHGTDLRALLTACHREPDDDTPRLVLADWLQEHDDP
ncbi:MAG: TIGR02996 domain-containing protein [Planctomycetia bacterium]|nr:TIGR02996 domain-containing protein [Planctomycetia bacterium]